MKKILPGSLFSIEIKKKNKPTKIYGLLHKEISEIKYGILLKENIVCAGFAWFALVEGNIIEVRIKSDYFKLIQ